MRVEVLDSAEALHGRFAELFSWAERVHMAYAWATSGGGKASHWRAMNLDKIERAVIGTEFAQTEPMALRELNRRPDRLRVAINSAGTFHPKVVLGIRGDAFKAIVGSANLTEAAFTGNVELNLFLAGSAGQGEALALVAFIEQAWTEAARIDDAWLEAYTQAWQARPRPPLIPHAKLEVASLDSLDMSWETYFQMICNQEGRPLSSGYRIKVFGDYPSYNEELDRTRKAFLQFPRFSDMSPEHRKLAIGTGHQSSGLLGTMRAAGFAKQVVGQEPERIGEYLDALPLHGDVDLDFATELVDGMTRIHGVSIGVASRLMAVKRPDLFVSVNKGSQRGLGRLLGRGVISTPDHYRSLLDVVWSRDWYRSPSPDCPREKIVWERRAALLDSALYEEV
jgi:hypothetical protein